MESEYILAGIALLAFGGFLAWKIMDSKKSKGPAPNGLAGTAKSRSGVDKNQKLK